MIRSAYTLLLVLLLLQFQCSQKDPEPFDGVSLEILNSITGEPVPNVTIQLLEDGTSFTTNPSGIAQFERSELEGYEIELGTELVYPFSIKHSDFHSYELNVPFGTSTLNLVPDSVGHFEYHTPVQLEDGIDVASYDQAGMDSTLLASLQEKISNKKYRDLHSLLIYKDGKLVFEDYYFGNNDTINFEGGILRDKSPAPIWWSRNEKHYIASVNKALTSIVTGIALDESGVTTDTPIKNYLPDYASYFEGNTNKSAVTYHHALNMTLGFQWDEWGSNDLVLLWQQTDFASFLLGRPNKGPSREWYYNSASPNLILRSLSTMTGTDIRTWADDHFYGKLGITDYKWQSQPGGQFPEGAARMYLRPRDMLKIGITLLDDGMWKGEQVIPAAWIGKCMQIEESPDAGDYSHFFWVRNLKGAQYLCAEGDGGNYINVFPDQNMVIVITQGNYLQWPLYVNQANDIMGNFVLPAFE